MIEKAIERYGGQALWEKIDCIVIDIQSIGGLIPRLKGIGKTFPHFGRVRVYPHALRIEFLDRSGVELGSYDAGTVKLKDHNPISDYRAKFSGFSKYRRWNTADAIYFFGYAITTYVGIPFILKNAIKSESSWKDGFQIKARFPKSLDTHNQRQSFYFNKEGLLVRQDYQAEILGWFAFGAHFTSGFQELNGFPIAKHRQVFARIGNRATPFPVLEAWLEPIEVLFK